MMATNYVYTNTLGLEAQRVVARDTFPHKGDLGLLPNSRENASILQNKDDCLVS
jgi:hypothetical protein